MLAQPENLVQPQDLVHLAVLALLQVHVVLAPPVVLAHLVFSGDRFRLGALVALCLLCRLWVPESQPIMWQLRLKACWKPELR